MCGTDQSREPLLDHLPARLKPGGWGDLERHAAEMIGQVGHVQPPLAECRIMDDSPPVACDPLQHDEMAHVPVQNCRQSQSREADGFEA